MRQSRSFRGLFAICLVGLVGTAATERCWAEGVETHDAKQLRAARATASREARNRLTSALKARDPKAVASAATRLAQLGGKKHVKLLLSRVVKIPPTEDGIYWALVQGIVAFQDREALEALADHLVKNKKTSSARDIMYGLARNRSGNAAFALKPLALAGPPDLRSFAVESLGKLRTKVAVDVLVEVLKKEEKSQRGETSPLMWLATGGLHAITRQDFGASAVNWEGWWNKNRDKPLPRREEWEGEGYGARTGTAVDFLGLDRRQDFYGLEKAPPRWIVVLSAKFTKPRVWDYNNDRMEIVLERMGIPHTVVSREDFMASTSQRQEWFSSIALSSTSIASAPRANREATRTTGCSDVRAVKSTSSFHRGSPVRRSTSFGASPSTAAISFARIGSSRRSSRRPFPSSSLPERSSGRGERTWSRHAAWEPTPT